MNSPRDVIGRSGRVSIAVVLLLAGVAGSAYGTTPLTPPDAVRMTVNAGPGNQTDPHVAGDIVVYTSSVASVIQIRYFNAATSVDTGIPTTGTSYDFLSDVSDGTIVFTRIDAGKQAIFSYDVATAGPAVELDPQPASDRRAASIGNRTVAWQDLGLTTDGVTASEIVAYDLDAALPPQRLTSDNEYDRDPAVSPDGNVIVWEKCATSTSPCDIWQAVKNVDPMVTPRWAVMQVTSTADPESFPDTNGARDDLNALHGLVVYGAIRAGNATGADIYWTPLDGGPEVQLALEGEQRNPNISGTLITFESRNLSDPTPNWDLYAYDLATETLFRLTDTPTLNDVSVTGDQARVVYSVLETDQNVYLQTFTLPSSVRYAPDGTCDGAPGHAILPPIKADGTSVFKQGATVPAKFRVCDADGVSVGTDGVVVDFQLVEIIAGAVSTVNENVDSTAADSAFRWDPVSSQWIFNISTKDLAPDATYLYRVTLDDGSAIDFRFSLK